MEMVKAKCGEMPVHLGVIHSTQDMEEAGMWLG